MNQTITTISVVVKLKSVFSHHDQQQNRTNKRDDAAGRPEIRPLLVTDWQPDSQISQSSSWLVKTRHHSCRRTQRTERSEHHSGRVNSRRRDTAGRWPGGGEIEGKRWGVKRTGCNSEGCWGGEMRGLNCWCKRGHTSFFFLSHTRAHSNAHAALTSCFYPQEVIQGSGVQMKTNNGGWTYRSSLLLTASSLSQSWSSIFSSTFPLPAQLPFKY